MIRRLVLGLVIGFVVGAAIAAVLVKGIALTSFGVVFAYLGAALTGVLTGLVAGKPIWSADGKIEAGLKAVFGALLAAGAMFALRRWVHVEVDLTAFGAGRGVVGDLPAVALPLVGATLGAFFEADNDGRDGRDAKNDGKRVAAGKVRVAPEDAEEGVALEEEKAPAPPARKKK